MPSSLGVHLDAVAASRPAFDTSDWLTGIGQWILANADPRKLIDTPDERAALERDAVAAFDRLVKPAAIKQFGEVIGSAFIGAIEPQLAKLLDVLFVALASTLPPTPAPLPVPVAPPAGA